jgi:hypothetical protein
MMATPLEEMKNQLSTKVRDVCRAGAAEDRFGESSAEISLNEVR